MRCQQEAVGCLLGVGEEGLSFILGFRSVILVLKCPFMK